MSENYLASVIYFVKSCPYIIPNVYSSVQSQRNQHLLKIKVRFIRAPDAASRIGRSNIKHQSRQIYFNEQRWLFNGVVTTNKAICMLLLQFLSVTNSKITFLYISHKLPFTKLSTHKRTRFSVFYVPSPLCNVMLKQIPPASSSQKST